MLDWTFITHYAPFFVTGSEMTLFISVFGIALAIAVGLVCAKELKETKLLSAANSH